MRRKKVHFIDIGFSSSHKYFRKFNLVKGIGWAVKGFGWHGFLFHLFSGVIVYVLAKVGKQRAKT
jgi:hypothetical protein